jgi:hypothetical protein
MRQSGQPFQLGNAVVNERELFQLMEVLKALIKKGEILSALKK